MRKRRQYQTKNIMKPYQEYPRDVATPYTEASVMRVPDGTDTTMEVVDAEISRGYERDKIKLMQALHDAINRPKGVVPESADEFYQPFTYIMKL